MISQYKLKKLFRYCSDTGVFRRKISVGPNGIKGGIAGSNHGDGYLRIQIDGVGYLAHRLAWLYVHGAFPENSIDHKNHIRHDNRIENLRSADHSENSKNQTLRNDNRSGIMGVPWHKLSGKWDPRITVNGKRIYMGVTPDFFEACCWRKSAENKYGFHANHGR